MAETFPPKGVAKPAQRALASHGVDSFAALEAWTEAELSALHGMGPNALAKLKAALAEQGKTLKQGDGA